MTDNSGRRRVVIEGVHPEIDCGRYPIKRTAGEAVTVRADAFCDGHDQVRACLLYQKEGAPGWDEVPMKPLPNDRWEGTFVVRELGRYRYKLLAWVDAFLSWRHDFQKRLPANQDVPVNLLVGAGLIEQAAGRASGGDRDRLMEWARRLRSDEGIGPRADAALSQELAELMAKYPDRSFATEYDKGLAVVVDRERARFSTWYELFPRSCSPEPGRHGTLRDCAEHLPRIAAMGFDVVYLPPIHPIGVRFRKGKNNNPVNGPGEPGSPWAIGGPEGGHTAIHPELGTPGDFRALVARARELGMEVALD
ncbi:MAG TPA: maltotransferase domain-containing protein, partial [Gemmataceae bacterium]